MKVLYWRKGSRSGNSLMIAGHAFVALLLFAFGCAREEYGQSWVGVTSQSKGYLSPSQYVEISSAAMKLAYPDLNIDSFSHTVPFMQEECSYWTVKHPDYVWITYYRCDTPENLRLRKEPLVIEEVSVMMSRRGAIKSYWKNDNIVASPVSSNNWDLYELWFSASLGTPSHGGLGLSPLVPVEAGGLHNKQTE